MAKVSTSWKPGQSGNPAGRPKKKRALTQALESSLNKIVVLPDGTRINGKRYLADLAHQAITTGKITLANGNELILRPEEMLMFWKFYFSQVDGPPPQTHELTGEGGAAILIGFGEKADEL
jgi:hypothetical protein